MRKKSRLKFVTRSSGTCRETFSRQTTRSPARSEWAFKVSEFTTAINLPHRSRAILVRRTKARRQRSNVHSNVHFTLDNISVIDILWASFIEDSRPVFARLSTSSRISPVPNGPIRQLSPLGVRVSPQQ